MTRNAFIRSMGALALAGALTVAPIAQMAVSASSQTEVEVSNPAESSLCKLYINGTLMSSKPFYQGRTLMLPLRAIVDSFAKWDYAYGSRTAVFGPSTGLEYRVSIGKDTYKYNGKSYKLDVPAMFTANRVYVPWQFIELKLGFKVNIANDGRIDVSVKKASPSITVNGRKVSGHPYKDGKVTMVPLRSIVEALGYSYRLDSNLHCSIFSAKNIDTHIFYGKNSYPVDNKYVQLERRQPSSPTLCTCPSAISRTPQDRARPPANWQPDHPPLRAQTRPLQIKKAPIGAFFPLSKHDLFFVLWNEPIEMNPSASLFLCHKIFNHPHGVFIVHGLLLIGKAPVHDLLQLVEHGLRDFEHFNPLLRDIEGGLAALPPHLPDNQPLRLHITEHVGQAGRLHQAQMRHLPLVARSILPEIAEDLRVADGNAPLLQAGRQSLLIKLITIHE